MERCDCGHSKVGRAHVTYCVSCIEQVVARAEKAEKLVTQRDRALTRLAEDYKVLLRKYEALRKPSRSTKLWGVKE